MGQHHALRVAGGARGVDDRREVDVDVARRGALAGARSASSQPRAAVPSSASIAPETMTCLQVRAARRGCGEHALQMLVGDQRRRPAVVQQVGELVGLGERIDDRTTAFALSTRPERRPRSRPCCRRTRPRGRRARRRRRPGCWRARSSAAVELAHRSAAGRRTPARSFREALSGNRDSIRRACSSVATGPTSVRRLRSVRIAGAAAIELVMQQLGGEDADQRHVVGVGERAVGRVRPALAQQLRHRLRLEHAGVAHGRAHSSIVDRGRWRRSAPRRPARGTAASCAPGSRPAPVRGRALQHVLLVQHAQLVRRPAANRRAR